MKDPESPDPPVFTHVPILYIGGWVGVHVERFLRHPYNMYGCHKMYKYHKVE